jgi:anti-sigma regulatory factor (Ser/Thr protein kinase)
VTAPVADALGALAAWIDERLDDELADRQFIAEQALARVKDIMRAVPDLGCEVTLPGVPGSVRQFRALARELAATPYQAEAAALCVSELVTNAIVHTRSGLRGGSVTVSIAPAAVRGELRISVCDDGAPCQQAGPWLSAQPDGPEVPEHGYGLGIVDVVAADWGRFTLAAGGWCTWCEISETADQPLIAVDGDQDGPARYELTAQGERACELADRYETFRPPRNAAEHRTYLAWTVLDLRGQS